MQDKLLELRASYPVYEVPGASIGGWLDEEAVWNVDGDVNLLDRCARGETSVFIFWWLLHFSFPLQADSYVVQDTAGKIEILLDRCRETTVIECLILWWPPRPAPLLLPSPDRIVESWSIVPPGKVETGDQPKCKCNPIRAAVGCH